MAEKNEPPIFKRKERVKTTGGIGIVMADCPKGAASVSVFIGGFTKQLPIRTVETTGTHTRADPQVKLTSEQRVGRGGRDLSWTRRRL